MGGAGIRTGGAASTWPWQKTTTMQLWPGVSASGWINLWSDEFAPNAEIAKSNPVSDSTAANLQSLYFLKNLLTVRKVAGIKHNTSVETSIIGKRRISKLGPEGHEHEFLPE
jgi:hypothetical protein